MEKQYSRVELEAALKDLGKYLIDHASKMQDGTMALSVADVADHTIDYIKEMP
jgi:hypothetical protein